MSAGLLNLTCAGLWSITRPVKLLTLDSLETDVQMPNKSGTLWANTVQLALHHMPATFAFSSTLLTRHCLVGEKGLGLVQHAAKGQGESAQSLKEARRSMA